MAGVDAVVHFAAETHVDRSNAGADEFLRTNVTGTFTLLEAARERKIGRFVAIGTDEVYGSVTRGASREARSAESVQSLLGLEGGGGSPRPRVLDHASPAGGGDPRAATTSGPTSIRRR